MPIIRHHKALAVELADVQIGPRFGPGHGVREDGRRTWPPGPSLGERLRGGTLFAVDSPEFYQANAERFGDVVSFRTPNGFRQYQFNHPDDIAEVLVTDAPRHRRGVVLRRARGILGDGLLTSEEPLHLRQRRLAQPAFHRTRLEDYARTMVELTGEMTAAWRSGMAIDTHAAMVRLTLRITSRCLLSTDVAGSVQTFVDAMQRFNDYLPFALLPGATLLERLPVGPMPTLKRALRELDRLIYGLIAERRRTGETGEDLLGMLLAATDEDGAMCDRQVRDEAMTVLLAGHETTANALTFALWLLARHPEIQERLAATVAAVCGERPPRAADCAALQPLEMAYAESIRLYPPSWVVARTAAESYTMGSGLFIPKGAHLVTSQLVVHRDARWWPEPLRFDPERWTPEHRARRPKFTYFPFGGGARFCIGERFAWMEGVLMLATVLQRWRLSLPPDAPEQLALTPKFTIRPRDVAVILVESRP